MLIRDDQPDVVGITTRLDIHGLSPREAAGLRADARVTTALAALAVRASSARVAFSDDNGPKGGAAIRCAITVAVPGCGRLHAEAHATTPRLALDGALAHLERRLTRSVGRRRANGRRPKKYYAARAATS